MVKKNIGSILVAVMSTVAAASLVGVFTLLRTLSSDVAVTSDRLENYRAVEMERHQMFKDEISSNTSRVTSAERNIAVLQNQQSIYHGSQ